MLPMSAHSLAGDVIPQMPAFVIVANWDSSPLRSENAPDVSFAGSAGGNRLKTRLTDNSNLFSSTPDAQTEVRLISGGLFHIRLTEEYLIDLVNQAPFQLVSLANRGGLSPAHRCLVAEWLGEVKEPSFPAEVHLEQLLRHESPIVREGAVRGLGKRIAVNSSAQELLRRLLLIETDDSVLAVANDILE